MKKAKNLDDVFSFKLGDYTTESEFYQKQDDTTQYTEDILSKESIRPSQSKKGQKVKKRVDRKETQSKMPLTERKSRSGSH